MVRPRRAPPAPVALKPPPVPATRVAVLLLAAVTAVVLVVPSLRGAPSPGADDPQGGPARSSHAAEGDRGLLHTPDEVAAWRRRAVEGPYRVAGDVAPHSPGDWQRIRAAADRFLGDPSAALWDGPGGADDGCVEQDAGNPPTDGPSDLRDAAFVALLEGDVPERDAVREVLLEQVGRATTDLCDRGRWCTEVLYDVGPAFDVAEWVSKLLLAYDYLGPESFSPEERASVDAWFLAAARFLQHDLDVALERLFVDEDRASGRLRQEVTSGCDRVPHLDGAAICPVHLHYNNRRATIARLVAMVGVHQDDAALRASASRFVEEFLAYGVFPDGSVSDFERWTTEEPDLGWAYGANTVASVLVIAEVFARAGDASLYALETSDGALGSEGGPKSLHGAARAIVDHVAGTTVRHATEDPGEAGEDTRIDGVDEARGWYGLHDLGLVVANVRLRDATIRAVTARSLPGISYPSDPASNGPHQPWTGSGGLFPGVLFQYGGMDGEVWPYPDEEVDARAHAANRRT
jgi:hypothetical protein